jgi:RNA polymerase sigma-32 factor
VKESPGRSADTEPEEVSALVSTEEGGGESGLVPRDTLDRYFAEIGHYPLLSREEEHELAVRVKEHGDTEAARQLVLSNLRLVVKIAMEYRRVWASVLDLIQEGNVGLLQAVKRFDPYRGVKLSSYSAYWIRAYILKYLIDNIRLVRVGSSRAERKLFFQLNRARRELESAGFRAEPKLLAERLDVPEEAVVDMERRLAESDLSIDAPVSHEGEGPSFGDYLSSGEAPVEEIVADVEMRRTLRAAIEEFSIDLDEREQKILRDRILSDDPKTLQEIGDDFGLTRERVRQIEAKLVQRLREFLKESLVDFDYFAPET